MVKIQLEHFFVLWKGIKKLKLWLVGENLGPHNSSCWILGEYHKIIMHKTIQSFDVIQFIVFNLCSNMLITGREL